MRKIRLDLDDLAVESFRTADGGEKKAGTVRGYDVTQFAGCPPPSEYSDCATCLEGCPADTLTCMASCRMTNGYQVCKDPYC
ncbi:MAG TPA: hypothetical protein VF092_27205 [Longimicrobium sp.]